MQGETYSLPRWRVTRWLTDAGPGVPDDLRAALIGGLFGTLPIYAGGVFNTIAVAAVITARIPAAPFIMWLALEVTICLTRLVVLIVARRNARRNRGTPTDIYLLLGVAWSASVGYGVLISMTSGDWVSATLACLSAAAMVGGVCFRNFSAPRLAAVMIVLVLGPTLPGAVLGREPLLYLVFFQIPFYLVAMTIAAFKLNKMLIATMKAERENDHRARHDALTDLPNRLGLAEAVNARLSKPEGGRTLSVLFLDLDGFKAVNDTKGHACGDKLLCIVADRLRRMLRASDIAARLGGDEFVVVANELTYEQAGAFAQRLITSLGASYELGEGVTATISVSIGIAMAPEHGTDVSDLLAVADAALYEAKSGGKARSCMASPMTNVAALRRLQAEVRRDGSAVAAA